MQIYKNKMYYRYEDEISKKTLNMPMQVLKIFFLLCSTTNISII